MSTTEADRLIDLIESNRDELEALAESCLEGAGLRHIRVVAHQNRTPSEPQRGDVAIILNAMMANDEHRGVLTSRYLLPADVIPHGDHILDSIVRDMANELRDFVGAD